MASVTPNVSVCFLVGYWHYFFPFIFSIPWTVWISSNMPIKRSSSTIWTWSVSIRFTCSEHFLHAQRPSTLTIADNEDPSIMCLQISHVRLSVISGSSHVEPYFCRNPAHPDQRSQSSFVARSCKRKRVVDYEKLHVCVIEMWACLDVQVFTTDKS